MKKCILVMLCLLINQMTIKSVESTDKEQVPYEIQVMRIEEDRLLIEGWGMLSSIQHFVDEKTHRYDLILTSDLGEQIQVPGEIVYNDQTEVMKLMNVRKCGSLELNQDGAFCYYDYKNVGFRFTIPLSYLEINRSYQVDLIITGFQSGISKSTKLFYPSRIPLIMNNEGIEYKIVSNLYDTALKVVYQSVFERQRPADKINYRTTSQFCSATYGYAVFYQVGAIFNYVYDRFQSGGTTYYKIYTKNATTCENGRNVSVEGNDYESWVAGNFVDYIGEPLRIEVKQLNEPPVITILSHPIIFVDEVIDLYDYAVAFDTEDGDLTEFIMIINGVVGNEVGEYPITFYVEDSLGAYDIKVMNVSVIEPTNTPPNINANDRVIYQYSDFDYYEGVWANDREDGWIQDAIGYHGYVDTEVLGRYPLVYYVMDSEGLIAEKMIHVKVIRNPREKIRYIDDQLPFYMEEIPRNWQKKVNFLFDQLKYPTKLAERISNYDNQHNIKRLESL